MQNVSSREDYQKNKLKQRNYWKCSLKAASLIISLVLTLEISYFKQNAKV